MSHNENSQLVVSSPAAPPSNSSAQDRRISVLAQLLQGDTARAERMLRMATMAVAKTPALAAVNPAKLFLAVQEVARLGLDIGPMGAWLIPFKVYNPETRQREPDVQVIVSPQGLIELAMRSGYVRDVQARIVRQRDVFEVEYGSQQHVRHVPDVWAPADEAGNSMIGAYAVIALTTGGQIVECMGKAEVLKARAASKQADRGPWVDWESEMWRKTVLKRAMKYSPKSAELREVLTREEQQYEDDRQLAAVEAAPAIPTGSGTAATLARLASQVPPALPALVAAPVPVPARLSATLAAAESAEPTDEEPVFEAQESELADAVQEIHGMLSEIRQHAEAKVITWPQARKIARILHERWPRYESELGQVREAYVYLADRHAAVMRIAGGVPTQGPEQPAAA